MAIDPTTKANISNNTRVGSLAPGQLSPPLIGGAGMGGLLPKGPNTGFSPNAVGGQAGGGAGAPGAAGPAGAGAGGTTNLSQNNPDIAYASAAMKQRYEGDNGAGRAIDLAMGKIRDSAEGERRAAAGRRSARGVSGTGVDSYDERNIEGSTQRAQAGAASDIAFGSEQAKTGLLDKLVGAGTAQGNLGLGERSLALQQYNAQQQAEFERAQAARAQEQAILSMLFASAA